MMHEEVENISIDDRDDTVKVICSCIPGFEHVAITECKEKLNIAAIIDVRGRITLNIEISDAIKLLELRSIHHYWVVVEDIDDFFTLFKNKSDNEALYDILDKLPEKLKWKKALKVWKLFKLFVFNNDSTIQKYENLDPYTAGELLSFRVTATRTGKHEFGSMDVARHFGGGVNDYLHWSVSLKNFDVEVVLYIRDDFLSVGIQLTEGSQGIRNICHLGPTTLTASMCYCLLRLIDVKPGEIVCDPMCGGGSISIEGSHALPYAFQLAADNHELAINRTASNQNDLEQKRSNFLPMSILQWDVYQLPLRTASIDHIITDLPFGKKIGSKERNMFLYPVALREFARVCICGRKCVFLTQHKQAMWKSLKLVPWWHVAKIHGINMGGLNVSVFILQRTKTTYSKELDRF